FASSTKVFGQARAISSSLPTTSLARSSSVARMSKARLPRRTGWSPSSSSRCAGRSRNGPNAKVCSPSAVADGSGVMGIAQLVQQLFRSDKISCAEAFGKSVIDRLESRHCSGRVALVAQQPGEARRGAEFPGQRTLSARPVERLPEVILGRRHRSGPALKQQKLPLDAQQLRLAPPLLRAFARF